MILILRRMTPTVLIALPTLLLSSIDALGLILSFLGATCAVMVVYIVPTASYIALFPHSHSKKYLATVVLVIGCVVSPLGIAAIFLS